MNARNKFLIVWRSFLRSLGVLLFSTPSGTIWFGGDRDANQIVVSPQIQGRISKLLVEEGTQVSREIDCFAGPRSLEAEARAAGGYDHGFRSQVSANEYTQSRQGIDDERCVRTRRRNCNRRERTAQAEATLTRVESDSRGRSMAQAGVASDQDRVQAAMNLKAQEASVQSLKDQVTAAQAASIRR